MKQNPSQQTIADQNIKKLANSLKSSGFELIFNVLEVIHNKLKTIRKIPIKTNIFALERRRKY